MDVKGRDRGPRIRNLEDLADVNASRVLVRLDLAGLGSVVEATADFRLLGAYSTIDWLLERGARVAIAAHDGVPQDIETSHRSLSTFKKMMERVLGLSVVVADGCLGDPVRTALDSLRPRSVLLLENLLTQPGEAAGDSNFADLLRSPFSHYVNDAFAASHLPWASMVRVPERMARDRVAAGRGMQTEIDALSCLMNRPDKPFVAVVAGRCLMTNLGSVERLLDRSDRLVCGGDVALAMLALRGCGVGWACLDDRCLTVAAHAVSMAADRGSELVLPTDLMVEGFERPVAVADVAAEARVLDLGPVSIERLQKVIEEAQTVFWYGNMAPTVGAGDGESDRAVATALGRARGYSVAAGYETVARIGDQTVIDGISHLASGGPAALALIGGDSLPALRALEI
jgi:phosphoglycerate kinase